MGEISSVTMTRLNALGLHSATLKQIIPIIEDELDLHPAAEPVVVTGDWPSDYKEQFWTLYPHKVGKDYALKILEKLCKSKRVSFAEIMSGLRLYAAKTDDRPWCNPSTWLNQGRWKDAPALSKSRPKASYWDAYDLAKGKVNGAPDSEVDHGEARAPDARAIGHDRHSGKSSHPNR